MSRPVNIFVESVLSSLFYMRVLKAEFRLPGLPGKVSLSLSNLANVQEKTNKQKQIQKTKITTTQTSNNTKTFLFTPKSNASGIEVSYLQVRV